MVCWKTLVDNGEELSQGDVEVAKIAGAGAELEARRDATRIDLHGVRPGVLKAGSQLDLDQAPAIAVDEMKRPVAVGLRFGDVVPEFRDGPVPP